MLSEKRFPANLSDNMLNTILRTAPAGIGFVKERIIQSVNEAMCIITGYAMDELVGLDSRKLYESQSEYERVGKEGYSQQKESDGIASIPTRFKRKDGSLVHVLVNSSPIDPTDLTAGAVFTIIDDSKRKQAEELLRSNEELVSGILAHSPSVIFLKDTQGRYQLVNRRFEEMFHISNEQIQGKTDHDIFPKEMADAFKRNDRQIINDEKSMIIDELVPHDDGIHSYLSLKYPLRNEKGEVSGICGIATDVTERKRAEEENKILQDQLRQAQKMEAVGQLAGGVAHDFNNLLQVILGYAEILLSEILPGEPNYTEVEQMQTAARQAADLTSQLLAFGRRQVIKPEDLNLNDLIEKLLKMMRRLIGEHINLDFVPEYELGTVNVDSVQIEQVLINLCVNAADAMPGGGHLRIETENARLDDEYARTHPWATTGEYVLVSVSDTGCGIDSEILKHIFDPFFTTKNVGKGTGLGLATVYGIVKQHKGYIDVESKVGEGSVFKIYLPLVDRKVTRAANAESKTEVGGTETILVAEDDEGVLALVTRILQEAGYTVLAAKDGEEAVRIFKAHEEEVDMALFDVVMPNLSGEKAMAKILEINPNLPHLYASGYSKDAIHTNFIKKKNRRLVNKPYKKHTLLREIRLAFSQLSADGSMPAFSN